MVEWVHIDVAGTDTGTSEPFEFQAQAEAGFATDWEMLAVAGTADIAHRDDGEGSEIYRMSLAP